MFGRIAYGLLAISVLVSIIAGDALISRKADQLAFESWVLNGSIIPLAAALVAIAAVVELSAMFRPGGITIQTGVVSTACCVIVLTPWLFASNALGRSTDALSGAEMIVAVCGLLLVVVSVLSIRGSRAGRAIGDMTATWFTVVYVGLLLGFVTLLRCDSRIRGEEGAWIILTFLLVTKSSDIGAYFLGSFFGRHKLAPAISPKKSVEGFIGGLMSSGLVSLLFFRLHFWAIAAGAYEESPDPNAFLLCDMTIMYDGFNMTQAIVFGVLMSFFGQMGDLFESLLKRSARIKDSGNLLPGFGGILDMIDSPIFAAPIAWFLLTHWWSIL